MGSQALEKEAEFRQVCHWMTHKVLTISRKENLLHAAKKMARNNVSCLVVEENNKPVGIITERDYLRKVVLEEKEPHKYLVEEVMTLTVRSLPEDADVISAFALMKKYNIRRFPVINRNGHVTGIVTQRNLLNAMDHIIRHLDWKVVQTKIAFTVFQRQLEDVEIV
ncbi:CBS domain-containing protein [Candidatus Woesearchaeota archaeon]|nr:CBS domain-containing protein [Candidatus Woesearchaeota archaeon]